MKKRIALSVIVIGFGGIIAQLVLLREFLIRFCGNELSIGIILANWLLLEAAGAFFILKKLKQINRKLEIFITLQLIFVFSIPLIIYLIRALNLIVGLEPGEALGAPAIFWSSLILLMPVCIPHGALFSYACNIFSDSDDVPGLVYVYSALGALIGGVIFTYLLAGHFNSFAIAFAVCLINILLCLTLPAGKTVKLITWAAAFFCVIFLSKSGDIHSYSIRQQWPKQNIVFYDNSVYGNVAVTKADNQYTFYSNGVPIFTTPTPDIISTEEFAHLVLLAHPAPEKVLIIRGGAGGLINEVLKYPIKSLDCCELDPLIIKTVKRFKAPLTSSELSDSRVRINYTDGRFFLKNTAEKYDIIMVGVSNPQDLQSNRFFTEEFYSIAKGALARGGILAITLPGSASFLSDELKKLNSCIYSTLKSEFSHVLVIPGDNNVILCSSAVLSQRFTLAGIKTALITEKYIQYKTSPEQLKWYLDSIGKVKTGINTDFKPVAVFYSLSYWNSLFSPRTQKVFSLFEKIRLQTFAGVVIVFILICIFAKGKKALCGLPYVIMTTGFCGMTFDLLLIFSFQTLCGFAYYWMGLIIAVFMFGIAVGGFIPVARMKNIKNTLMVLLKTEVALIIFICAFPVILNALRTFHVSYLALAFISGLLTGAEFPLAAAGSSKAAGILYAADLMGGWAAGILAAIVLVPVLGVFETCALMFLLKISSFVVLLKKKC